MEIQSLAAGMVLDVSDIYETKASQGVVGQRFSQSILAIKGIPQVPL